MRCFCSKKYNTGLSPHARVKISTRSCGVLHTFVSSTPHVRVEITMSGLMIDDYRRKKKKYSFFKKKNGKCIVISKKSNTFASQLTKRPFRAFSSAGSEHLPYKQRV
ncbi:hypothetical protein, partial [uncultured Bacteroides sp.]|uniref:hypothetical protein n=1 Tax=uncultured Bacteroides sp. TaxID=162156 RepID=UPI00262F720B